MKSELEEMIYEAKSNQERLIIKTLIDNYDNIENMKLDEIANLSFCSKTSVRRVILKLGYKGYLEFQLHVKLECEKKDAQYFFGENISEARCKEISNLIQNKEHLSIYGNGPDSISAQYFFRQLLEMGYNVTWINEFDLLHSIQNDTVIVISNTGRNKNIIEAVKDLKTKQECFVVGITKNKSDLSNIVDTAIVHELKHSVDVNDPIDAFLIINQICKHL